MQAPAILTIITVITIIPIAAVIMQIIMQKSKMAIKILIKLILETDKFYNRHTDNDMPYFLKHYLYSKTKLEF